MIVNKDLTKDYFNQIAKEYSVNNHKGNLDKSQVFLKEFLPVADAPSLLECGGGGGFYTQLFLKLGYNVDVVDISEEALLINKNNAEKKGFANNLNTYAGNFNEIVLQLNKQYNQVVFIKVLHHFDSITEIKQAVEIGYNSLKNNGRLIIFEPNGRNPFWEMFLKRKYDKVANKTKWDIEKNLKYTTVSNLTSFFNENKISYNVKYKYVIPAFLMQKQGFITNILKIINNILEKIFLKYWAFNVLIIVNK